MLNVTSAAGTKEDAQHKEAVASAAASLSYFRAGLIGLFLLTGLLAVTPYNDYFVCGSYMANHHVPVAASFVLFCCVS